jgi:hypothetical protein
MLFSRPEKTRFNYVSYSVILNKTRLGNFSYFVDLIIFLGLEKRRINTNYAWRLNIILFSKLISDSLSKEK